MAALSALRTRCRAKLRDPDGRLVTDAQLTGLINEALVEWVNRTEELRTETAFPVVASQFLYDAPADMIRPLQAWWGSQNGSPIDIVPHQEFISVGGYSGGAGVPQILLCETNPSTAKRVLRLWPAPSASSKATTLTGTHSGTVTTFTVASVTDFRSPAGWLLLNALEKVIYQSVDAATLQFKLARRGWGNTTAGTYTGSEAVAQCDVVMVYLRRPDALTADADVPQIAERWHFYLTDKVVSEGMKMDGRLTDAQVYERQWETRLVEAKRSVRNVLAAPPTTMLGTDY